MENGFTDGTLDAAQDTSATTKHTVTIDTSSSYKIRTDTIYDVTNNHDGTLTVGVDPKIIASSGVLNKTYSINNQLPIELYEKEKCVYKVEGCMAKNRKLGK